MLRNSVNVDVRPNITNGNKTPLYRVLMVFLHHERTLIHFILSDGSSHCVAKTADIFGEQSHIFFRYINVAIHAHLGNKKLISVACKVHEGILHLMCQINVYFLKIPNV